MNEQRLQRTDTVVEARRLRRLAEEIAARSAAARAKIHAMTAISAKAQENRTRQRRLD